MRKTLIGIFAVISMAVLLASRSATLTAQENQPLPNILWITSEDNGPQLGCYGDDYADTPNLDRLAGRGMIYRNAWSTAPVCAPARTTIITGCYPPSLGAQHMRSLVTMPSFMKMYPQFLKEKGYYCTNNSKEDYNVKKPIPGVWDESSRKGHWRNREKNQPFFAIFNFTISHESKLRNRHDLTHDPAKAPVPAYHPDTPEVRRNWAQYYDRITQMDAQAGGILDQLAEDGLTEETIIFYYGDHGSGMPRSKRWPYNSGLHVPMIVSIPEKFRHLAPPEYEVGGESDRLVGFVDLAPTLLSLVGIAPPEYMQGKAFLGPHRTPDPEYMFGFRGRMDERYDCVRTVRNERFHYIRNYMPHKIYGQYIRYMFVTQTTRVWNDLYQQGQLEAPQTYFWETKPAEELYDLKNDPDEVHNLADDPEYQDELQELRQALYQWQYRIRDLGFLPESQMHARAEGITLYEMGHDPEKYPMHEIFPVADLASSLQADATEELIEKFDAEDPAIRYWAAMGMLMRGPDAVAKSRPQLLRALEDPVPSVRVAAAEALGRFGNEEDLKLAMETLLRLKSIMQRDNYVAMEVLNAIDKIGAKAKDYREEIAELPVRGEGYNPRAGGYNKNLLEHIEMNFE